MMAPQHIDDDVLFDYAEDPSTVNNRETVERHLHHCIECSASVDEFRAVIGALHEGETWWLAEEMSGGTGRRALHDLVARWEAEDAQATEMIGEFLKSPYRFAYANIPRKRRFYTGGVVRLLCEASRAECDREPQFALALADAACLIAEALPDNCYPASAVNQLRGNAWKEYSTACRYLARFEDAVDALKRAERAYRRLPDSEIQVAVVDLCRAAIHWEQNRHDEALLLARSAGQRFITRRDTARYLEAQEWEAMALHHSGQIRLARDTYARVFEFAETLGDAEMKARAAKNLSVAYRDLGDTGSASKYLAIALQLYEGLNLRAMVVHTRWSIARLTLFVGNISDAVEQLSVTIADLAQLGMTRFASVAQLDLAKALLLLSRYEEVQMLAASLGDDARRIELYDQIIDRYLHDCYTQRTVARVSELAQLLDVLRPHLSKIILHLFGKSLTTVLREKQITEARRLLSSTTVLSLDEIASGCAFGDRSTFYRVFREALGMTPDKYRTRIRTAG